MSDHVWMDHDTPAWIDDVVLVVGELPSTQHAPGTVGSDSGDEVLVLLITEAQRAAASVRIQLTILRDEMRLTALDALAADNYTMHETIHAPTEHQP